MKVRWGRVVRLSLFTLVLLYVGGNLAAAWIFVGALIYPPCPSHSPILNFSSPEQLHLQTSEGVLIPAWYYPSQNGAAIIALGGMGGALGHTLPDVGPLLEAGYSVLQIGSRACATPVRPVTLGAKEVMDAEAGLAFLLMQGEVDPARIGIYGFSMGGVAAIRTAARRPEISAVLAEGGYFNLGEDIVEPGVNEPLPRKIFLYTIAGVFWLRTGVNPWQVSPVDEIGQIGPRSVLLIYGEHEAASGRAQMQFDAAEASKELWIVPGGDHGKNHLIAPEAYQQRVMKFFSQTLLASK
jgi:dipeptidyl aminopeptidase/acylaminoacyl peptidase